MIRTRYLVCVLVLLTLAAASIQAAELPESNDVSPDMEHSVDSSTMLIRPVMRITRPLVPLLIQDGREDHAMPISAFGLMNLSEEAGVESEDEIPTYWRILAPVLITAAVGTATWMLFTIRSG